MFFVLWVLLGLFSFVSGMNWCGSMQMGVMAIVRNWVGFNFQGLKLQTRESQF
jgi:hypothetical protein